MYPLGILSNSFKLLNLQTCCLVYQRNNSIADNLSQWFSNIPVHQNQLEDLLKKKKKNRLLGPTHRDANSLSLE